MEEPFFVSFHVWMTAVYVHSAYGDFDKFLEIKIHGLQQTDRLTVFLLDMFYNRHEPICFDFFKRKAIHSQNAFFKLLFIKACCKQVVVKFFIKTLSYV